MIITSICFLFLKVGRQKFGLCEKSQPVFEPSRFFFLSRNKNIIAPLPGNILQIDRPVLGSALL